MGDRAAGMRPWIVRLKILDSLPGQEGVFRVRAE